MAIIQLPTLCPGSEDTLQIQLTKSSDKTILVTLKDSTGNTPLDLVGASITMTVRRSAIATDIILVKTGSVVLPSANGNAKFVFIPSDTSSIASGIYNFTITVTSVTLGTQTPLSGEFILEPYDQALIGLIEPILTLSIIGATERVSIETRDRNNILANPAEISLQVLDPSDSIIATVSGVAFTNPQAGIYSYDFASNRVGDFLAIWTYRFPDQTYEKVIKNIRFVSTSMWKIIPEVRSYIDKSRKATNATIGYTPADIAIYIENALRDFNSQPPTTSIQLENLDNVYKEILVLGSIIQALIAQGILAVDQDFMYNDNGISLSIDHSGKLLTWYQALIQNYITKKKLVKWNFFNGTLLSRTIVGSTFSLGFAKIPPGSATRFRGWL